MRMICAQRFVLWCASIDEQIHSISISTFPAFWYFSSRYSVIWKKVDGTWYAYIDSMNSNN